MSEPDLQTLLSTIGKVNDTLLENPRCAKILRGIQDGEYPDLDAGVRHLMVALKEEGLLPELQIAAKEVGTGMISQEALEAAGRPLHMKTSTGINQLNPLVEAAIAERVGLDGDVPEARYGPFRRVPSLRFLCSPWQWTPWWSASCCLTHPKPWVASLKMLRRTTHTSAAASSKTPRKWRMSPDVMSRQP